MIISTTPTAFSIGGKGYVGLGYSDTASAYKKYMWQYDPTLDTWTRLNDFPGTGINDGFLFSIGDTAYIGFGSDFTTSNELADFWQYNPNSDTWLQLTNTLTDTIHGGSIGGVSFGFSMAGRGYLNVLFDSASHLGNPGGYVSSYFFEYDPTSNLWSLKDSFPDSMIFGMGAFTIANKAYVGIGSTYYINQCKRDFWMYTPDSISTTTGINSTDANSIIISPNPATDKLYINSLPQYATLTIIDMAGRSWPAIVSDKSIDLSTLSAGIYCLQIQNSNGIITKKFIKQ